jgi:signal transduction histidine kinase
MDRWRILALWRHSLVARIFLPTALILTLCVAGIGLYTHWRTQQAFRGYVTARQGQVLTNHGRALATELRRGYRLDGGWAGAQQILQEQGSEARLIVTNRKARVVADSANLAIGQPFRPPSNAIVIPIVRAVTRRPLGKLILIPDTARTPAQRNFLASVDSALLLAGLGGLAAALALAFLYVRRLTRPLTAMRGAAVHLAAGDLAQRVPVPPTDDEVAALARAFNRMAASLEDAQRQRQAQTADIAHELRTPLTSIRGYLEALQDGAIEASPAIVDSMHEEVVLLSELMCDLQDLALADAGQLRLHRTVQPPEPVLEQAVAMQELTARERSITLRLVRQDAPLPPMSIDAVRLGQVLRNLIANALTHTPSGGSVTVAARGDGQVLEIAVGDTGRGIPPEHLSHIFDRFYRADPSRDRSTGGIGIGLSVARTLVQAHDGTIAVSSTVGQGSEFRITLPCHPRSGPRGLGH